MKSGVLTRLVTECATILFFHLFLSSVFIYSKRQSFGDGAQLKHLCFRKIGAGDNCGGE